MTPIKWYLKFLMDTEVMKCPCYLQMNLAQIYKQNLLLNKGNIIISLKNAFHDADDE